MKRNVCLCLLALLAAMVFCGTARGDKLGVVATFVSVKGEVEVSNADEEVWRPAKEGDLIKTKDIVRTQEQSECSVRWLKGNSVKLLPETEVEFRQLRMDPRKGLEESLLILKSGRAFLKSNEMINPGSMFIVQTINSAAALSKASLFVDAAKASSTCFDPLAGAVKVAGPNGFPLTLQEDVMSCITNGRVVEQKKTALSESDLLVDFSLIKAEPDTIDVNNNARAGDVVKKTSPPTLEEISDGIENDVDLATLLGGGQDTASIEREKDKTPPGLMMFQPQAVFTTDGNTCTRIGDTLRCTVSGMTEPGAKLTINGVVYSVNEDGSFSHTVEMGAQAANLTIATEDSAGNREVTIITRDPYDVLVFDVTATPSPVVANGLNTSTVSAQLKNFQMEPLDGLAVTFTIGAGGSLSSGAAVTSGGVASVVFTPALTNYDRTVTVTAQCRGMITTFDISVLADFPQIPGN